MLENTVTAYVEHAIARCIAPTQQLLNNQVHDDHDDHGNYEDHDDQEKVKQRKWKQ